MTDKYRWNLESMYENDELARDDLKYIEENLEKVEALKTDAKNNLKDLLLLNTDLNRKLYKVWTYSNMRKDENSKISKYQKLNMEVDAVATKHFAAFAFLKPLLLSLTEEEANKLLTNPQLEIYKLSLERIFRYRPHTLSDKEEFILSSLSTTVASSSDIYYFLTNADMRFPKLESTEKELKNSTFVELQNDENREIRKESFKKFYDTYASFSNTIASTYYANLNAKASLAKLRNFASVRQEYLFEDDVDERVYDALIESVHKNLPAFHKYYALKKKALGLDEQHMYDVYMPISKGFDKKYSFEEAKELVLESIKPLGAEYEKIYRTAFEDRWIDVEPREGKRGGAYSSGSYDSYPFVLLNFNGTLDSVFTLAHEMGHSMHSYYDRSSNDFLHSGYTIFVAEVASTFNEALLLDMLMKRAETKEEKIYLLDFYIDNYKSTVFRQTMFAEFEREVHKRVEAGEGLTAEDFNKIYYELNKLYFGPAMNVDEEIACEWMRIPHFYSDFYVYKYATGYSASAILSQKVLSGEEGAVENYMKFLKDGCNHFPIEQLRIAGVDMADPASVDKALEVFSKLVDQLEEML